VALTLQGLRIQRSWRRLIRGRGFRRCSPTQALELGSLRLDRFLDRLDPRAESKRFLVRLDLRRRPTFPERQCALAEISKRL
jgi:hypothetical protein